MKILIAGDLVINQPYQISKLSPDLLKVFEEADLKIVNLEAPVTNSFSKIMKTGPNHKSEYNSTSKVLGALNVDVVTLANNHILDYDQQGVSDTLDFCKKHNILSVGAGMSIQDASKTLYIHGSDGCLAIVNFTENEWTIATDDRAGANPMCTIDNTRQIREAKEKADFVLVVVHGGNEYNPYPSPRMVKQYRFYVESGADMVVGHHTHCIGGYEKYLDAPIFYSLGNFLFTASKRKPDAWYSGLLLNVEVLSGTQVKFEILPTAQSEKDFSLTLYEGKDKEVIMKKIYEINDVISNKLLLQEKWTEFVDKKRGGYIKAITPIAGISNRYLKAVLYRSGIYKWLLNKTYIKESLNRIRCESHYDVVEQIFKRYINR